MGSNRAKTSSLGFTPVLIVLLLAAAVAVGLFLYTQYQAGTTTPPTVTPPEAKRPLELTVESPTDATLAEGKRIMVKGKTSPNTTVVIYSDGDQNIVESDSSGKFEGSVGLGNGINALTISAFSDSGEEKSVAMDIVYDDGS